MPDSDTPTKVEPGLTDQPHLVSLVLRSKKAFQHGEQLCLRASAISSTSAQTAVDVLALDAKVRWMTDAVLEQLKLAAGVAKSIELKRTQLERQAKEWDLLRSQRTDALDSVLESLGAQVVPPDFHSTSSESSLFGSQHSDDERDEPTPFADPQPGQSPTETLRGIVRNGTPRNGYEARHGDRAKWKTLRDFVDERGIEDVLDAIESDRNALDDILARTADYPESLSGTIAAIQSSLPAAAPLPSMDSIFTSQENASTEMADLLKSLTDHYDVMAGMLRDSEAGEELMEADLQAMQRDTEELHNIIFDLEKNIDIIESSNQELLAAKGVAQDHLVSHRSILNDLDELSDIMSEMLERQQAVEAESAEHLTLLYTNLASVEDLYHRFKSYQYAYNKLVIELARRRLYREAAEKIVEGMMAQLDAMTEEEQQRREAFNAEHGDHLPSDVCLCIQNAPTRWEVLPWNNEPPEVLPMIEADLLAEANGRVSNADAAPGWQSL